MNELVVPADPNWFCSDVMACAPDHTLIYGSQRDLIIVKSTEEHLPNEVKIIPMAHNARILCVGINKNWGNPDKHCVTASENRVVKIWDLENMEKKMSHNKHLTVDDESKIVAVSFCGDTRVVSVSENGTVIICNLNTNQTNSLPILQSYSKVIVTCLAVCPHKPCVVAFGLKNGLVLVGNLIQSNIIMRLRAHSRPVVSLAWCPAPINIFPSKPMNKVVQKKKEVEHKDPQNIETFEDGIDKDPQNIEKVKEEVEDQNIDKDPQNIEKVKEEVEDQNIDKDPQNIEKVKEEIEDRNVDKDPQNIEKVKEEAEDQNIDKDPQNIEKVKKEVEDQNMDKDFQNIEKVKEEVEGQNIDKDPQNIEKVEDRRKQNNPEKKTPVFTEYFLRHSIPSDNNEIMRPHESDLALKLPYYRKHYKRIRRTFKVNSLLLQKGPILEGRLLENSISENTKNELNVIQTQETLEAKPEEIQRENKKDPIENDSLNWRLKKYKNSEDEVSNWRTQQPVIIEEEPRLEYLLASSAREPDIYIWRAGTDGRLQTFLKVPSQKQYGKAGKKKFDSDMWISLCWISPTVLLSSSRSGELLRWNLPKPVIEVSKDLFLTTIHREHWNVLFCIKGPIQYRDASNFLEKCDLVVWTNGMERKLLKTNVVTKQITSCYHAVGGQINVIAVDTVDPYRLALGSSDGTVNVWLLSEPHKKIISFKTFYKKILSSVTAVAWQHGLTSTIAWGTVDGRVGIIELTAKGSKEPKIFPDYFKTQIFKMEWGPADSNKLFVVCNGKIAIYDTKTVNKEPEILLVDDEESVYTMAWKPNHSTFLVATKNNRLLTYLPDLTVHEIIYLDCKLQSIFWHPDANSGDPEISKYCNTFVSIVKRFKLVVFDFNIDSDCFNEKIVAEYENQERKINSVAWSPHNGKYMVLVDHDGIAQVFDFESNTIISTYMNPCADPLLSVYWSPCDSNMIIVGTATNRIIIYDMSQHPPLTEEDITIKRKAILKAQMKEANDQVEKKEKSTPVDCVPESKTNIAKMPKNSLLLPIFYACKRVAQISDINRLLDWKQGKVEIQPDTGTRSNIDILDLFSDAGNMKTIFNLNMNYHASVTKHVQVDMLRLFQGNINEGIYEAIEKKRVTPWLISICPMVSHKLWCLAVDTYVDQLLLEKDPDPLEVTTYMLANHKVTEAVEYLKKRLLFREALLLAKCRFGASHSLVLSIYEQWSEYLCNNGIYEMAACCYIALEKYKEAADLLYRRNTVDILELAVKLAELSGNSKLLEACRQKLEKICQEAKKQTDIEDVSNSTSSLITNLPSEKTSENEAISINLVRDTTEESSALKHGEPAANDVQETDLFKEDSCKDTTKSNNALENAITINALTTVHTEKNCYNYAPLVSETQEICSTTKTGEEESESAQVEKTYERGADLEAIESEEKLHAHSKNKAETQEIGTLTGNGEEKTKSGPIDEALESGGDLKAIKDENKLDTVSKEEAITSEMETHYIG